MIKSSRRLAVRAVAFGALLWAAAVCAQTASETLNPVWQGDWQLAGSNRPRMPATLQIRAEGQATRMHAMEITCELTYDGTITQQAIVDKLKSLREWQLRVDHWPAGTDVGQLVGLQKEFDDALRLMRQLPPGRYRRVRPHCGGPQSADDEFHILNEKRLLFALRFPANALGAGLALYERAH